MIVTCDNKNNPDRPHKKCRARPGDSPISQRPHSTFKNTLEVSWTCPKCGFGNVRVYHTGPDLYGGAFS